MAQFVDKHVRDQMPKQAIDAVQGLGESILNVLPEFHKAFGKEEGEFYFESAIASALGTYFLRSGNPDFKLEYFLKELRGTTEVIKANRKHFS